ncbi:MULTISPECIES: NYN domain-containing protein [unclassified Nitrospina]|uniref:NYN domain-containing protein n=1 Tax=unclassified Nitrospina TaxID=2638683 RepID=UPI003F9A0412
MPNQKVNVYIDGFNFYYGCTKGTPYKWLDFRKLCQEILPNENIDKIKYFTAKVKGKPHDPEQPLRQQIYFRALRTIPNFEIHFGHFLSHTVRMPVANSNPIRFENVLKTEEKGSDVNLATHLLVDAFQNNFELAVIISNDSDLYEPIKVVKTLFHKKIGILNPHKKSSTQLKRYADFTIRVNREHLNNSQFPDQLSDEKGSFHKPLSW